MIGSGLEPVASALPSAFSYDRIWILQNSELRDMSPFLVDNGKG